MKLEDDIKAAFGRHADDAAPNPWAWSHVQEGVQCAQKRRATAMTVMSIAIVATMGAAVARIASTGPEPGSFASSDVTTFRFETTGNAAGDTLEVAGAVDLATGRRSVRFTLTDDVADDPGSLDIVADGDVVYLHRGEEWIPANADPFSILFFGGSSLSPIGDPAGHLTRARGFAASEEALGRETIRGVETTGHEVVVDVEVAARRAGGIDAQLIRDMGGEIVLRIWVDESGLTRRQVMIVKGGPDDGRFTTDLFDFGMDVSIDVPRVDREASQPFTQVLFPTYTGTTTCAVSSDGSRECHEGVQSRTFECTGSTLREDDQPTC